ncbi:MAG: pentapeptide repeat-containing protein, partial [Gloeomargarita sp. GMQP_bins_14]
EGGRLVCGSVLVRTNLSRAILERASLVEANLSRTTFFQANLRGADLRLANLYRTNFDGADLTGAQLRQAKFCGVNLKNAIIDILELSKAQLDPETRQLVAERISSGQWHGQI